MGSELSEGVGEKMNLRKEKTVITVENYRRVVRHSLRDAVKARCGHCNVITQMISPGEAAELLQTSAREIFRLIEAGEVHFSETDNGALLVCRSSCQVLR